MTLDTRNARDSRLTVTIKHPTQARDHGFLGTLDRISESVALTGPARAIAAALAIVTTTFFLLCSFSFSYINIVRNVNARWVYQTAQSYAWVYWVFFFLNAMTLLPAFRSRNSRWMAEAFLIVLASIGLLMTRVYRLTDLPESPDNLAWSVVLALPLAGLGLFDLTLYGFRSRDEQSRADSSATELPLHIAFFAGGLVALWYFTIAWMRYPASLTHSYSVLATLAITVLAHGFVFVFLVSGFSVLRELTARASFRLQWLISLIVVWLLASVVLRKLVTPALSFNSVWADVWSFCYPFAFIVMLAGFHSRRVALSGRTIPTRVESVISGLIPENRFSTALVGVIALLLAFVIPYTIERVDWNFLFQRLTAIVVWFLTFVVIWRCFARTTTERRSRWRNVAWCLAAIAACFGLAQTGKLWHRFGLTSISQSSAAYRGMDSSLQATQILFRPAIRDTDRTGLFAFLRRHALMDAPIAPPKSGLVESLTSTAGPKPDIYIIVIDCMRRDYLSPYNPRVQFTPHIAAFAKESFVFQHAYTNYGGTALSEPAIWAGEMMPSKLYVEPFAEMNALEQLANADGYHRLILRDMVLNGLLKHFSTDSLLVVRRPGHIGFDFRDEAPEIVSRSGPNHGYPLFVYTQPQNLHPITLHELAEGGEKLEGQYPGFNARFADELHKVDSAFGELIDGLKSKGVFENSIVILTADHGDWLGEYGRWGHGQFLLGPILQVPLFIHLPSAMAQKAYVNVNQNVFLTDITPSLYYLLGHRNLRKGEFFGRPLFTETAEEQNHYAQRFHLMMSSYDAIFGILDEQNQTLYMADALDDNQALYNLTQDPYGLDNILDPPSQKKFEQLTRSSIERLEALYGYSDASH